ncbi:MAG: hypothetical protein AAF065_06785 [Verrucomicrobiota bacterium]
MDTYAKVGVATGLLLILVALGGYLGSGMESWTALIPSFVGIPIFISSLIARNPDRLKLGMHIAATFGLLGFFAPLGRIIPTAIKGEFEWSIATSAMAAMLVICGVFVVLCVKSFIDARKKRLAG